MICLIIMLLLNTVYSHNHDDMQMSDGTVVVSGKIVTHAVMMTLITFVGFPLGYYFIIRKNYTNHKIVQIINILLLFIFGLFATFSFSDHSSLHSLMGLCILPLLIIQSLKGINYIKKTHVIKTIHYYLGRLLIITILPVQWMMGIQHIISDDEHPMTISDWAHFLVGYTFIIGGIFILWNFENLEKIMKFEIYTLVFPLGLELLGEIYTHDMKHLSMHGWDHIILDSYMIFTALLCIIYKKLELSNRNFLHKTTMAFAIAVFGYAMLSHQHGNTTTAMLHQLSGQISIFAAILRWFEKFYYLSIVGILAGITLMFSHPKTTEFWENGLGYPSMPYIVICLFFGFYLSVINLINYESYNDYEKIETEEDLELEIQPF